VALNQAPFWLEPLQRIKVVVPSAGPLDTAGLVFPHLLDETRNRELDRFQAPRDNLQEEIYVIAKPLDRRPVSLPTGKTFAPSIFAVTSDDARSTRVRSSADSIGQKFGKKIR